MDVMDKIGNADKVGNMDDENGIKYLDYKNCKFEMTSGGFLKLTVDNKEYPCVELYKTFPFTHPRSYVFVKEQGGNEIGCIKDLDHFPQQTIEFLEAELKRRYFVPKILKIIKLKEELGEYKWVVETDSGRIEFNTSRRRGNLLMIDEKRMLVKDIFGNRYEIPNIENIRNSKYRRMIEAVIY